MPNVLTEQLRSNSGVASAGSPRARGRAVKSLVVIGNGMVSYKLCERLAVHVIAAYWF